MKRIIVAAFAFSALWSGAARAQQPAAAPAAQPQFPALDVGAVAPDFTIPGATRYGILRDPIKLSDFKGKTVVLAFFFRARTRG